MAWQLIQRQCRVLIVDYGEENASLVAAGLINPVTGMRLAKTANVEVLLPYARQLYAQLAEVFGTEFFIEKPMLRILANPAEHQQAEQRLQDSAYRDYLAELYPASAFEQYFAAPYGVLAQQQTAYVLTCPLLKHLQDYFRTKHSYQQTSFNWDALQLTPTLKWQEYFPKQIIFCEGYRGQFNPWFKSLPFRPAKGEILTLQAPLDWPDQLLNYRHWLLPLGGGKMRLGASFERDNTDPTPSLAARHTLLTGLQALNQQFAKASVLAQQANIRPCTADRYPFIGRHPEIPQMLIFNGFGAKGSLQIPWYSEQLTLHLLQCAPLPATAEITRFQKSQPAVR